ncbi:uncharacterized protein [Littorina saxatilis]|uniref:uncharacterized protein n=1 Tax=Littorina saxatilis TaxID=31220 RepID=UPI0038B60D2A
MCQVICRSNHVFFVAGDAQAFEKKLEEELVHFRGLTFAENTVKTYQTHLTAYLDFCKQLGIPPVPVSEREVALFAAFLARRMKPSSVKQYINIVRILHLEAGFGHPFEQSWSVKTTLRGIDREKGCQVMRKAPITPGMLLDIKRQLNLALPSDALFWAACMVMFFGLLRKSNLFEPGKQLTRDCFVVEKDQKSIIVLVKSSKNNQFRERVHKVSLPVLDPHPLCPVSAVVSAFRLQSTQTGDIAQLVARWICIQLAAVSIETPTAPAFPLSAAAFARRLRLLVGGRSDISSHSFRRGSATWALSCGVPVEVIKVMGDWKSSAYLVYLDQIPQRTLD